MMNPPSPSNNRQAMRCPVLDDIRAVAEAYFDIEARYHAAPLDSAEDVEAESVMLRHQEDHHAALCRAVLALTEEVERLTAERAALFSEVDCRIEHGAESNGHLEYVRARLAAREGGTDAGSTV